MTDEKQKQLIADVSAIDWEMWQDQLCDLIERSTKEPTEDLKGVISFYKKFRKRMASVLGKDVVYAQEPTGRFSRQAVEFCQEHLIDHGHIYCPYCLHDHFDSDGVEGTRQHFYECLICEECGNAFSIRYENPTFVTPEEMHNDINQSDNTTDAVSQVSENK